MNENFKFSLFIRIILTWYILILLVRFFILDYTWNPIILILPIWFFIMIIGGYNEFQFRNYIQDKYFDGEFIGRKSSLFPTKTTYYIPNFSVFKNDNKVTPSMTIRWDQNNGNDNIIQRYVLNGKFVMKTIVYFLISIPFIVFLTTINWSLK